MKNSEIAPTGSMVGRGGGRAWRQVGPACLLHVHLKKRALSQRNEARTPLPHVTGAVFFTRFEFISHTGVVVAKGTGSDRQGGLRSTKKPCPHPMDPVLFSSSIACSHEDEDMPEVQRLKTLQASFTPKSHNRGVGDDVSRCAPPRLASF